ncbi:MAG TPA: exopolyphosphatase, partial [Frankiaceae bacterium]|nr:exopolyphosphatase [Frankiaceae bacterium]
TDVAREMRIVRLGEGVDLTGRLSEAALDRTMTALREYAGLIAASGSPAVRMVSTSATRDAENSGEFTERVTAVLGVAPEVISGDEEARLSFAGATRELAGSGLADVGCPPPYLVTDIGGGSTEFILGGPDGPVASRSVDIGCVRMTERHIRTDPPAVAELQAAEADIAAAIADVGRTVDLTAARTLVAVAGTATTVTALALGLPAYDPDRIHLSAVSLADVERIYGELSGMDAGQRAALGPMHPGRVDVIIAGALILRGVVRAAGTGRMIASEHDILDGITLSLGRP